MTDMKLAMEELQKPFPASDIEWRVQRSMSTAKGPKAVVLAYVTNRAIMNRLDEVFGIDGWKNEYKEWRDKGVLCGISVKIDGEWVTKWDGAEETQVEATKGGFSGSMKRAAVQWGIGRYLYNLTENWVDIKDRGEHYINTKVKVNDSYEFIKGYWDTPKLPSWALPSDTPVTPPITLEIVLNAWKEKGGTEEQFVEYVQKQFNCTPDKLHEGHLIGIKKVIDQRKAS